MMLVWLLLAWSILALAWWLIAFSLVRQPRPPPAVSGGDDRRLTIFKPLAGGLAAQEANALEASLATFAAELDENSEMLLGVHAADAQRWRRWSERMSERHPGAAISLVVDGAPERLAANPKVSWMRLLAPHATGALWLWSDADMQAPQGTLSTLRRDFTAARAAGAGMVTSPYVVQTVRRAPALLDAAYVNLEHYPGALLLGRLNRMRFGFGAGMLFEADAVHRRLHRGAQGREQPRADLEALGAYLADDFHLGRMLSPVRLGTTTLATEPASGRWAGALVHYHRWRKTVRWCAPGGFAAELLVLPAVGWLAAIAVFPGTLWPWLGLAGVAAMDTVAATSVFSVIGCRLRWRHRCLLPAWTVIRALTWIVCWMPVPIVWRRTIWRGPRHAAPPGHRDVISRSSGATRADTAGPGRRRARLDET